MDAKDTFSFYLNFYIGVAKKFTVFEGRARRREYWTFFLLNLIIGVAFAIVSVIPIIGWIFRVISGFASLAICVVSFSVGVRRLHDRDKSGWFQLIALIPLVGIIILIVVLATDSGPDNKYGPNPKKGKGGKQQATTPAPKKPAPKKPAPKKTRTSGSAAKKTTKKKTTKKK